jgi:hypothetical protein
MPNQTIPDVNPEISLAANTNAIAAAIHGHRFVDDEGEGNPWDSTQFFVDDVLPGKIEGTWTILDDSGNHRVLGKLVIEFSICRRDTSYLSTVAIDATLTLPNGLQETRSDDKAGMTAVEEAFLGLLDDAWHRLTSCIYPDPSPLADTSDPDYDPLEEHDLTIDGEIKDPGIHSWVKFWALVAANVGFVWYIATHVWPRIHNPDGVLFEPYDGLAFLGIAVAAILVIRIHYHAALVSPFLNRHAAHIRKILPEDKR